ncbi:MAG: SLC13 family permease [Fusobacteriota bacterium]
MIKKSKLNFFKNNRIKFISLFIFILFCATSFGSEPQKIAKNTPDLTLQIIIIGGFVFILIVLFFLEIIPLDIISLSIPVILVILNPWIDISVEEALSGFSNKATVTILAMFILSEGIQKSGGVEILAKKIEYLAKNSGFRLLTIITTISGISAAIINNTPVVATFIPMVTKLSRKMKVSPSKILIPLSYASMMGGMITLIGTSTNILASDISNRLLGKPFSMFEFTKLGIIIFIIGLLYILLIGTHLIPERIKPKEGLFKEYKIKNFLTEVVIDKNSPLIGKDVSETLEKEDDDLNLVQIIRGDEQFIEPLEAQKFQKGDHLVIRTDKKTLISVLKKHGIKILPEIEVKEIQLEKPGTGQKIIEVVIPHGSSLVDQTLKDMNFLERYDAGLLAVRRGESLSHTKMEDISLHAGDVLLLIVNEETSDRLYKNNDFIVETETDPPEPIRDKVFLSSFILILVILLAAFNFLPIAIAAIGGAVAMVVTGCLKRSEVYDSINWEVIFLLAGLIPLGIAIEKTGAASYVASQLTDLTSSFSPVVILGVFYLFTAVLTNLISNNASAVIMLPIAIDIANRLNANPFAFVLAVTFAASTAFLTPMGYQTNLMVYGPGRYKFRDFVIVGAPLQILLAIITPILIKYFWGL